MVIKSASNNLSKGSLQYLQQYFDLQAVVFRRAAASLGGVCAEGSLNEAEDLSTMPIGSVYHRVCITVFLYPKVYRLILPHLNPNSSSKTRDPDLRHESLGPAKTEDP